MAASQRRADGWPTESVRAPSAREWWAIGALAFLVVIAAGYPSLPQGVRNWDNAVKLQVARNILRGAGPVVTEHTPDDAQYVMRGADGRLYTGYPPLAYVLQFATVAAHAIVRAGDTEGIPALLLLGCVAWAVVAWGRRSQASLAGAVGGAMLVCFGTALWPSAAHGYDNLVEVLSLTLVLWAAAGEERPRSWLWAGLAVGSAFATRLGAAVLAVPAAVALVRQTPRQPRVVARRALEFVVGCTPGIALVLWFNLHRFGSPFIAKSPTVLGSASSDLVVPWLSRHHWEAIAGLTISPGKGILWYGPPLVGVLLCMVPLARRYRIGFLALGAYCLAAVFIFGRLVFWHSEWAWGPRYMAPLYVAAAPLTWWLWPWLDRQRTAVRAACAVGFMLLLAIQAAPVVGYPIEVHMNTTMRHLAATGQLVTPVFLRPPVPADNLVLYFRLENSQFVSLGRALAAALVDPTFGPLRAALARAMLGPAMALALVAATSMHEVRRTRATPPAVAPA